MKRSGLTWAVAAPIALVAAAVIAAVALDAAQGGAAKPAPLLGELGTPVRGAFTAPEPTATGQPTPRAARPTATSQSGLKGTPEERDATRRSDLLRLLDAATKLKARDGGYPDTKRNVQTLCVFKDNDLGCAFKDTFGGELPLDPAGDPTHNGYFYSSDGQMAIFYAALEGDLPDEQKCQTDDKGLATRVNVICVRTP